VYLHARRIKTNTPWLCYTIHHWSIIIKCFRRWEIDCCCYDKVCNVSSGLTNRWTCFMLSL